MKRFNKRHFYYHLLVNPVFVIIFNFFSLNNEEIEKSLSKIYPYIILEIILVTIICDIYSYFYYATSGYELRENEINCKRGVFFKRNSVLKYSKMQAINKKQNIIQRLFGIAVLTVDSGSTNTAFQAEITIIEKEQTVDNLLKTLKQHQLNKNVDSNTPSNEDNTSLFEDNKNLYSFTSKRKIIYSILNSVSVLVVNIIFLLLFLISTLEFLSIITAHIDNNDIIVIITSISLALGGIVLFAVIGNILCAFIGYYKFNIYKTKNSLEISYGLIVKNSNSLELKKIKAVKINQSLIKRIFGFVSISLEVIGYGQAGNNNNNNNANIGILLPLCKLSEVTDYLNSILPNYVPLKQTSKSKSFLPYVCWTILFSSLVFIFIGFVSLTYMNAYNVAYNIIESYIMSLLILYAVVLLYIFLTNTLEYKTTSVSADDNKITIYRGGIHKTIAVIQKENLIAIEKITTPLRQKNNIYSYKIHFRTNSFTNTITARNLDGTLLTKLDQLINY